MGQPLIIELMQLFVRLRSTSRRSLWPGLQTRWTGSTGSKPAIGFSGVGLPPVVLPKHGRPRLLSVHDLLAHKIITERHRGTISMVSEVNRGTTFTVSIPQEVRQPV